MPPPKARTQEGGFCHLPQAGFRATSREQLHAGDKPRPTGNVNLREEEPPEDVLRAVPSPTLA